MPDKNQEIFLKDLFFIWQRCQIDDYMDTPINNAYCKAAKQLALYLKLIVRYQEAKKLTAKLGGRLKNSVKNTGLAN